MDAPSLAVIGCGYWGAKHIRVAHECPRVNMAIAVDARQERLDYIKSTYPGVAVSTDLGSVLANDEVDGVIIATPVSTHFSLAKEALNSGKHVLVEKPLATSSAECHELNLLADREDRVLMVGHTFEYHPAVQLMHEIIKRGDLGEIYYINSRRLNLGLYRADTNVLWDLAPHDFSILFSVLGERMKSISAWGCTNILPNIEDVVYTKMEFESDVTAHVHVSWLDPVKVRQVTVVGSEGMLVFDDVDPSEKLRIFDKRFTPPVCGDTYANFQSAYHDGKTYVPQPLSNEEPLKLEIEDFINAIATGELPRADGYSGLRVVEALEAATRCLRASKKFRPQLMPSLHEAPTINYPQNVSVVRHGIG
jgi:predicted dehydrogenase